MQDIFCAGMERYHTQAVNSEPISLGWSKIRASAQFLVLIPPHVKCVEVEGKAGLGLALSTYIPTQRELNKKYVPLIQPFQSHKRLLS